MRREAKAADNLCRDRVPGQTSSINNSDYQHKLWNCGWERTKNGPWWLLPAVHVRRVMDRLNRHNQDITPKQVSRGEVWHEKENSGIACGCCIDLIDYGFGNASGPGARFGR